MENSDDDPNLEEAKPDPRPPLVFRCLICGREVEVEPTDDLLLDARFLRCCNQPMTCE